MSTHRTLRPGRGANGSARTICFSLLAHCTLLPVAAGIVRADDAVAPIPFSADNGLVRLPVTVAGEELSFILATGTSRTAIDTNHQGLLGPKTGNVRETGGFGVTRDSATYRCPEVVIGGHRAVFDGVICGSLARLGTETDQAVDGLLGIDFLREWVVQVDWDNKSVVLSRVPAEEPSPSDLTLEMSLRDGIATVDGRVNGDRGVRLWAATEAAHQVTLVRRDGGGVVAGSAATVPMIGGGGDVIGHLLRLDDLELGGCHHRGGVCAVLERGGDSSALGCSFWKRYRVTFDFPRTRVILRKRENFPPDEASMSGLYFRRERKSKIVRAVVPDSPGAAAGILSGDRMLSLDGKPTDEMRLSEVRAAQVGVGRTIEMEFDRDGRRIRASVTLRRLL